MGKPVGAVVQRAPAPPVTVNPLIELGAPGVATPPPPVVVVKKTHTNPARTRITLRTSSNFRRSGTLSRTITPTSGDIHIFTKAIGGTEIDFVGNTNTTFSAGRLNAGVPLFAEARARSGSANDFQLTLTLAAGPTPIGPPRTVTLTAIDVTLDVAVSRTSAAVDPPVLSEADKINPGRFIQVRDPQFSHLRAMIILRLPNPNVPVTFRLEALRGNVQAFGFESPALGQAAQPSPATFPSGIFPANGMQLFVEGTAASTAVRNTGFRLGINGLENEADRVVMTALQVEIANTALPTAPAVSFARMGLWDNAFRPPGDPKGPLFNDEKEANNFIGADTRRFHIRVRDVSAKNSGHVQIDWLTLDKDDKDLDAPVARDITLVETPANSGVFISRGLMLVTDSDDQKQGTHSGLSGALPDAGVIVTRGAGNAGARNHRIRRGNILGSTKVIYKPTALTTLPLQVPVFRRNPESRRRLPLQIFVLRVAPGGNGVITTGANDPFWSVELRELRETYARFGIVVETVVAPGTPPGDIVQVGSDSIVLIAPPAGVNPLAVAFSPTDDEATIGTAFPALPNTIRVFYTGGLVSGNRGEAWPDVDFAGRSQQGAAFLNRVAATYNAAHEIGHILTDKRVGSNGGHYLAPAVPAGNRLTNNQNLMRNGTSAVEGVNESKRLWDNPDGNGLNQFAAIVTRPSRYTRAF